MPLCIIQKTNIQPLFALLQLTILKKPSHKLDVTVAVAWYCDWRLRIFKDSMGILSWHRGCGSKSPIYLNQESLPLAYCSIYTNPHCDLWWCYFANFFPVYLTERKYTSLNWVQHDVLVWFESWFSVICFWLQCNIKYTIQLEVETLDRGLTPVASGLVQ